MVGGATNRKRKAASEVSTKSKSKKEKGTILLDLLIDVDVLKRAFHYQLDVMYLYPDAATGNVLEVGTRPGKKST